MSTTTHEGRLIDYVEPTADRSAAPSFLTRMARAYRKLMDHRQDQVDREIRRRLGWRAQSMR